MTLDFILQLAASATTLFAVWRVGGKTPDAPLWGALSEAVWLSLIVYSGLWGLLPVTLALAAMHIRNWRKWRLK